MKKILLFTFFLIVNYQQSIAQQTLSGIIRDAQTFEPISQVLVVSLPDSNFTITNNWGEFELLAQSELLIEHLGYVNQKIIIQDTTINIELEPADYLLNEAVVLANHRAQNLSSTTSAITRIDKKEIEYSDHLDYSQVLNSTPGLFMHTGALNTNRITIRGIGSRNLFGTAKIRAYYGNIPLTNGSGESNIENLTLSDLESIEIIRGPSGNQFGAGLGGTILLNPSDVEEGLGIVKTFGGFGSFGGSHYGFQFKHGGKKNKTFASYQEFENLGYRDNNYFKRRNINIFSKQQLTEKSSLDLLYTFVDLFAEIPSSLNSDDFTTNPTNAAFTWDRVNGNEDSFQHIIGLNWKQSFKSFDQSIALFYNRIKEFEVRPFNVLDNLNNSVGSRVKWDNYNSKNKLKWLVGFEVYNDQRKWKTFETEIINPFETGGTQAGDLLNDFEEKKTVLNTFLQSTYQFSLKLSSTLGLNINKTNYTLKDLINIGSNDQSAAISFPTIVSPKFDISFRPDKITQLSMIVSHGFSPPTLEETLLPDGLVNFNIRPETGWNYELGMKSNFQNKISFEANLYFLQIKNLLVARRTDADQFIGINAGKSNAIGVEFNMNYRLLNKDNIKVNCFLAYNSQRFKFIDFEDDGMRYDGNFLPGLPNFKGSTGMEIRLPIGFALRITHLNVSSMFLRDDNILKQPSYGLTNLVFQQKIPFGKWQASWSFKINNLTNQEYASMLLINAGSFGGSLPRYYYPGRPRNYYGQFSLSRFF